MKEAKITKFTTIVKSYELKPHLQEAGVRKGQRRSHRGHPMRLHLPTGF